MDDVAPIECMNVWKVFGSDPTAALQSIRDKGLDKDTVRETFDCVIGVADVSLRVERGEILCIMGLSGSGKSTLLRHINRLIEPTEGRILVNGRDIAELDRKGLELLRSRTIGMVFQHMALWPHRNIRDNISFGLEVRGIDKKTRHYAAEEVLDLVKLGGWGSKYPDELSGGMQQRVGLARALAADPDILLMDEPFSALDPLIRTDLQDQFLTLSKQLRKTTLFVTHDLEEAIRLGHRVAIMKDGEIVQIGTAAEILLNPKTDYVRSFIDGIPTLKFMTASDAMAQDHPEIGMSGATETRAIIPHDRAIAEAIDLIVGGQQSVFVTRSGREVGCITSQSLLTAVRRGIK